MEQESQVRDHLIICQLIDALPEAVIVIGAADRVIAVNAPARVTCFRPCGQTICWRAACGRRMSLTRSSGCVPRGLRNG